VQIRRSDDEVITSTDLGFMLKVSGVYEVVENHEMPTWVEWATDGYDAPNLFARIEIRKRRPEIVMVQWSANQYQREVRQRDLRALEVDGLLEVLYGGLTYQVDPVTGARHRATGATEDGDHRPGFYAAQRFIQQQRRPEVYRTITPELLKAVAKIYIDNVADAPRAAVAKAMGISPRTASRYIEEARSPRHGLLPKTSRGKKSKP
jgi:hypothetical protein